MHLPPSHGALPGKLRGPLPGTLLPKRGSFVPRPLARVLWTGIVIWSLAFGLGRGAPERGLSSTESRLPGYDSYGGYNLNTGRKTGFFHTEQIGGCWDLFDAERQPFLMGAVFNIDPQSRRPTIGEKSGGIPRLGGHTVPPLWCLGLY